MVSRLRLAARQHAEAIYGHHVTPLSDAYPAVHCCRNQLHRWLHRRGLGPGGGRRSFRDRILDRVFVPVAAPLTVSIFPRRMQASPFCRVLSIGFAGKATDNSVAMAINRQAVGLLRVIERRFIAVNALPPNEGMEPTVNSVTLFAGANRAPFFPAAHPRRWAELGTDARHKARHEDNCMLLCTRAAGVLEYD